MSMSIPNRRLKRNPAPPHSPNIIHLPIRRPRKENRKPTGEKPHSSPTRRPFLPPQHEEREFSSGGVVPIVVLNSALCAHRRERAEENWMVQAEMWRAECSFLRMERVFAMKKLERNRVQMEATLRSAVQALVAGKKKVSEGKNEDATNVEQEIEELAAKLEELRRSSTKGNWDSEIKRCSKKLSGWGCERGLRNPQHLFETNLSVNNGSRTENKSTHGELDGRETEEGGSTNSSTPNNSVPSSTSSPKFSITQNPHQEEGEALIRRPVEEEEKRCSGQCKAVVRKIIEQVKAESDQWSQMQEMLGRVRTEMQYLHSKVQEWKEKAQRSEAKAKELEKQLSAAALEKLTLRATNYNQGGSKEAIIKPTQNSPNKLSTCKHIEKEKPAPVLRAKNETHTVHDGDYDTTERRTPQISLAMQIEKEKRRRSPFGDVANSTRALLGQMGQNE
ncbi:hypothetical protein DM860_008039 [Cuscuta australis]|uniref:Uncharacterized protein n=1 Tax=Cuscuta australis TaxID=267555 RepID=A0A328D6D1_9ASTE|nr:hypothetical protein DM860_008039 [Cuscuta australis]